MTRTRAWELVNNPEYASKLNMIEFRNLLIQAGYSKEVVRKAYLQRGWDRMSAGETA